MHPPEGFATFLSWIWQSMVARLNDIAAMAGVSPATASRVLNGRPGVAAATRKNVMTAVDILGFERPISLRPQRAGLVGVVIAELENPVFSLFAQEIDRALRSSGFGALIASRQLGMPAEKASIELLREHGVTGIIFVSGYHADTTADFTHYQELRKSGMPLAFINGYMPDFDASFVADDDEAATEAAVRHLISLGHRRIGLATGPARFTPSARKIAGFQQATSRWQAEEAPVYVGDFSVQSGAAAAVHLAERGCTGIITASDFIALGVIRGVRSLGLDVPQDISVVGFGGSSITAFTDPPLTTLLQSTELIANAAVRSLLEEIERTPQPRQELLFEAQLVVRESTGPVPLNPRLMFQPHSSAGASADELS